MRSRLLPPARAALATLAVVAAVVTAVPVLAQDEIPERALELETIELEGNRRTELPVVLLFLPLRPGQSVTPDDLLDAIAELRASDLFAKVEFRTARGSERGKVRLILRVREHGLDFRLGTGFRDLDGWYLIPGQLRWDGLRGRGDRLRLQIGIGYRLLETRFLFEEPRVGSEGRWFWGAGLTGSVIDRRYWVQGVAYHHRLQVRTLGARLGRHLGSHWRIEVAGANQFVEADSVPTAAENDELRNVEKGDPIPWDELPPAIADHVGDKPGNVLRLDVLRDTRSGGQVSFTPRSGLWGRVRAEALLREDARAARIEADLRAYQRLFGGALALRLRGGVVGEASAFYDRFYLGGLYTVRGFPDQSLSPPEGDTHFWTAALEFRARLAGPRNRPRLMGSLFVDAGQGWQWTETPVVEDVSVSAGYGFRLRVPWLDSIGIDFGVPLTESPTQTAWFANFALGWNY